tara:strand:- start:24584 stop:24778 length:195 start_codon:yes stop_codon:yes gene_type:complete
VFAENSNHIDLASVHSRLAGCGRIDRRAEKRGLGFAFKVGGDDARPTLLFRLACVVQTSGSEFG